MVTKALNSLKKPFDFLEHVADIYVASYGRDLKEAFENAALAMFEVMTDTSRVSQDLEESVEVKGDDEKALLYNWLEELIFKFETKGILFSRFKVTEITRSDDGYKLSARAWGEVFNPEKHIQKVGVKSITYHMMDIKMERKLVTVKFLLDV